MGIVKLFSANREKNNRRISLKYDPRRHSSMSLFTPPTSISSETADEKSRKRMTMDKNMIRKRDSAIMINTPGMPTNDAICNPPLPPINKDIQTSSRKKADQRKSLKQESPKRSNRRGKSKALSLYDIKCTCDMPHAELPSTSKNRVSAPILDIGNSNKYEFSIKERGDQDPVDSCKPQIYKEIDNLDNKLQSELLASQQILKSIVMQDLPHIQKPIEQVISQIAYALEHATSLESRLNTVVNVSKQTILHKSEQIKQLEDFRKSEKKLFDATLEDNKKLKEELNKIKESIKDIEYLLYESQIEPTEEDGGTLLQRVESLLAISTASSLLNEKLASELETSDTRVRELLSETAELRSLVQEDQKLAKEDEEEEIYRLKSKICDLEENVSYLKSQLQSSKETIRVLNEENQQKSKQLLDSDIMFKKKIDAELSKNIIISPVTKFENNHLRKLIEEEEDSVTAWQEVAQSRLEMGGYRYEIYQSNIEQPLQNLNIKRISSEFFQSVKPYSRKEKRGFHMGIYEANTSESGDIQGMKKEATKDDVDLHMMMTVNYANSTLNEDTKKVLTADQSSIPNMKNVVESDSIFDKGLECVESLETDVEHYITKEKSDLHLETPKKELNMELQLIQNENNYTGNCQQSQWNKSEYWLNASNSINNISKEKNFSLSNENMSAEIICKKEEQSNNLKTDIHPTRTDSYYNLNTEEIEAEKTSNTIKGTQNTVNLEMESKNDAQKANLPLASLQHENNMLLKFLGSLQNRLEATNTNEHSLYYYKGNENKIKGHHQQQEELMRIHARAQLGLIEFLEGENNVSLAISRFRKQLENDMNELNFRTT